MILMFLMTILVVALFPKQIIAIAEPIRHQPWKNLFIGFLAVICMVPIAVFLGITLVGIKHILIFIVLFMLAGFMGGIAVNYILGHRMLSAFNVENIPVLWCVFSGLFILEMLTMIPMIAIIILPILYLIGMGSIILTRFGSR